MIWAMDMTEVTVPAGLQGPVTIERDARGIPHVRASSLHDLFFGQGWATAADRLWHLEWDRRRAAGTLAAATGTAAHAVTDGFVRRARLGDAARAGYASLTAEQRLPLDAHVAGINALLAHRSTTAAGPGRPMSAEPELAALSLEPAPFEPWECVAIFLIRHVVFATFQTKLWRARVLAALGADAVAQFNLEGSWADTPVIVPAGVREAVGALEAAGLFAAGGAAAEALAELTPLGLHLSGSNCWVVAGTRTASGRPIIAGDPHRALEVPNVYYQVRLTCPEEGIEASGFSFPGVPGIQHFGQNDSIAWGVTNAMADYQDLYVERLPEALTDLRTEVVEVAGGAAIEVECAATRHGPVVVGSVADGVGVALASTGLVEPAGSLRTLVPLLRATSVAEADAVLADWVEPLNNWVLADRTGTIAYRTAGKVPVRPEVNAWLPVPGWRDDHDWQGVITDDALPREQDPAIGAIVTANQRVTTRGYPHLLGSDCYGPARAQRIWDRLEVAGSATTLADHGAIACDTVNLAGLRFASLVDHPLFADWDGRMDAGSAAAALYGLARDLLVRRVVDLLPDALRLNPFAAWEPPATALPVQQRVANAIDGWVAADDVSLLPAGTTWAALAADAVAAAAVELSGRFGDDPAAWTWGALHELTPLHALRDRLGEEVRPRSGPVSGASGCVMATNQLAGVSTHALTGSTARYLWDLADPTASRWVVPLGASGVPGDAHFDDQTAAYVTGEAFPVHAPAVTAHRLLPGA